MTARLIAIAILLASALATAQPAGSPPPAQAAGKDAAAQARKAPTGKTQVTWWGHAAFVITTPAGTTLAVDPWFGNPKAPQGASWPEAVDAILITHGHFDHVGDAVELARRTSAKVIGSFELVTALGVQNGVGANIGGTIQVGDASITLVEAVHSSGYSPDQGKTTVPGGPAMGFVIRIDNGPTLYHAGDTAFFSSMQLLGETYKITHALLPIGGHFTMDPQGAAVAARLLKPRVIIPMHYGTFELLSGTPKQLRAALKTQKVTSQVTEAEIGKPLTL